MSAIILLEDEEYRAEQNQSIFCFSESFNYIISSFKIYGKANRGFILRSHLNYNDEIFLENYDTYQRYKKVLCFFQ